MILIDYNQVVIAALMCDPMARKFGVDPAEKENLVRHIVLNTLRALRQKFTKEFGEIVLCKDDKNYWRKQIFPYYKHSRKKSRESSGYDWKSIYDSIAKITSELEEHFPYPIYVVDNTEADDIIAMFCKLMHEKKSEFGGTFKNDKILIVSADKDLVQLQKYPFVQQYSPLKKSFLVTKTPQRLLKEHIIKGDAGDGIPSILSDADSFVLKKRQSAMTKKRLTNFIVSDLENPASYDDVNIHNNYLRNKQLIDLSQIPKEVEEKILDKIWTFELDIESKKKNRRKMFNFFVEKRLKLLTESIGDF